MVAILTGTGVRIFCALLSLALFALGTLATRGIIDLTKETAG